MEFNVITFFVCLFIFGAGIVAGIFMFVRFEGLMFRIKYKDLEFDPRVYDIGGTAEEVLQRRLEACLNEIESLRALRLRDGDRLTAMELGTQTLKQQLEKAQTNP